MSGTPVLDRVRQLPPPVPPRSEMRIVYVVWLCILAGLAAAVLAGHPAGLRQWLLVDVVELIKREGALASIGWTVAVGFIMTAVHEGGHVIGGLAAGFRFRSIRVGPLQFDAPFRLQVVRPVGNPFAGVAIVVPTRTDKLVRNGIVMLAAGPAANILSGCLVLVLPLPASFPLLVFAVQSIGNGLSDLLPYRAALGVSDGKFLWALFRHPARAERWLATMRLSTDIRDGILPESLPADFIDKAVALQDESIDTVAAHAIGYLPAFHQRRDADAARMLDICLTFSSRAPAPLRAALMSEAAVFQARRRGRSDLAEQWLADLSRARPVPWIRARAEAAILEARGDLRDALEKLDQAERELAGSPESPQRAYSLQLLRRWKSQLGSVRTENDGH